MLTPAAKSAVAEIRWPALPDATAATLLALAFQLERTQWWPQERLREHQFAQLGALVAHAFRTVPFHRERLAAAGYREGEVLTADLWAELPLLTRREVQEAGYALHSPDVPASHGTTVPSATSGSTGMPVRILLTETVQLFWHAFVLRDRLWHRLDGARTFCAIRDLGAVLTRDARHHAAYPDGLQLDRWGDAYGHIFPTGRSALLDAQVDVAQQAEWLQRQTPAYLLTFPSNAVSLARHCRERGIALPGLERVLTLGEVLTPEVRAACRDAWGAGVIDAYSATEAGYVALQCPEHEHYHVQSEGVLVEVLDDRGRPCEPGAIGRVVLTPLHNLATPLLRYDVGDHAEVGPPCPCGRGLPVLNRIVGRARGMLRLPSGATMWPSFGTSHFRDVAPIRQLQVVQRSLEELEVRLVPDRPITPAEEAALRTMVLDRLGHPFTVAFSYHHEIPRAASGKYEDFRSELVSESSAS